MTNLELAQGIHHGLFADRGTDLKAAITDAYDLLESIPDGGQITGMTALHIVLNTISNILKHNEMETIK